MPGPAGPEARGRLAIVAGWGQLPLYLAQAARVAGDEPVIVALSNEADQSFESFETLRTGVGDLAGIERFLREKRVGRVVMSGAVRRRPEWRDIRPTLKTFVRVPAVVRTLLSGGDDTVLQMVIRLFEGMGCRVVGAHDIAPDLLARTGALTALSPSADDLRDIEEGIKAALALGELDIGQGAVSVGGRVVALEGVEGTDRMLERVATLRREGRISRRRRGVLVKLCKPQQDMRADLPAIGISTVTNAARAGLAGIAVEAGRALVLDEQAVVAAADNAGLFIGGIDLKLPRRGL
ncbi:LpxI family protein [Rhizobium halophilum]|uniref:LpxI family protein n=1 Tax=Rhizobium halophilum TaxID=2846852 RepID=UPI001EFD7107|nr:UDP-2,3-diacylglucosamine diphosphatase LpxI [Rhizobium halophilum]MCF6370754.1 UDP-2,3-diacylglucosamine diphosphatase LpxI [Rhizobium halophilum]